MISALFERRSYENPAVSLTDYDPLLHEALGGYATRSGFTVSPVAAQKLSAVWAAKRVLSEDIATLPLHVFRRDGDRRELVKEGPLAEFARRPDPARTRFALLEWWMSSLILYGNLWNRVERLTGRTRAVRPIHPRRVTALVDDGRAPTRLVGAKVDGEDEPLIPDEFLHVPGHPDEDWNGLVGVSVIRHAAQSLGLGMALQEQAEDFFVNGARVAVVLHTEQVLKPETKKRLKEQWEKLYTGRGSAYKTAVLEQGLQPSKLTVGPGEAKLLELMEASIEDVARWFRLPPHKLGILKDAKYANIEHQGIDYVRGSITPYTVRIESVLDAEVLTDAERRQGHYFRFNLEGLLRGDSKARAERLKMLVESALMNRDEARALEDLPPMEGDQGQAYTLQSAMTTLEHVAAGRNLRNASSESRRALPAPAPEVRAREEDRVEVPARSLRSARARRRLQEAYRQVLEAAAGRVVNLEVKRLARAIKKARENASPVAEFWRLAEPVWEDLPDVVQREIGPVVSSLGTAVLGELLEELERDASEEAEAAVTSLGDDYVAAQAGRWTKSSRGVLKKLQRETEQGDSDPEEEVDMLTLFERQVDDWKEGRASRWAQTQAVQATGALSRAGYVALGVVLLRWVAFGDACEYCLQLNGIVVGVEESFLEEGSELEGSDGPLTVTRNIGHPPAHEGCDCGIVAEE